LWLYGLKRFSSTNEFTGMGFIINALNNAGNWIKGSETYWPIVGGAAHGITFNLTTVGAMQYKTNTIGGTGYTGLFRAKKVILKL